MLLTGHQKGQEELFLKLEKNKVPRIQTQKNSVLPLPWPQNFSESGEVGKMEDQEDNEMFILAYSP